MNSREKKLLQICVKHLQKAVEVTPQLNKEARFGLGKVTIPEPMYFALLASLDSVNNIKDIIKERVI